LPFDQRPEPPPREPAINLPPATLWLIVLNVAIHGLRQLLSIEMDNDLVEFFGAEPRLYFGGGDPGLLTLIVSPVSYQFLHASWLHLGLNMVWLMAFGSGVEKVIGWRRFLLFYLLGGVLAFAGHAIVFAGSDAVVIGASGSVAACFGGALFLMQRYGRLRSILPVAVAVVAVEVGLGLWGEFSPRGEEIAWAAHVAGLLAGLALIRFFLPRGA
jgi:membrane associated rhomboid family serine protease